MPFLLTILLSVMRTFIPFLALLVSLCTVAAQAPSSAPRVDPISYLQKLYINKIFSMENNPLPVGMRRMFVDTIRVDGIVKGFTTIDVEGRRNGWRVWMDFDADRWNDCRLTAVRMRQTPATDARKVVTALWSAVEKRMVDQVGKGRKVDTNTMNWDWIPRFMYRLTIRLEPKGKSGEVVIELRYVG